MKKHLLMTILLFAMALTACDNKQETVNTEEMVIESTEAIVEEETTEVVEEETEETAKVEGVVPETPVVVEPTPEPTPVVPDVPVVEPTPDPAPVVPEVPVVVDPAPEVPETPVVEEPVIHDGYSEDLGVGDVYINEDGIEVTIGEQVEFDADISTDVESEW